MRTIINARKTHNGKVSSLSVTIMHILSLLTFFHTSGTELDKCEDAKTTGIFTAGTMASCADLAEECGHPTMGSSVREKCPVTCCQSCAAADFPCITTATSTATTTMRSTATTTTTVTTTTSLCECPTTATAKKTTWGLACVCSGPGSWWCVGSACKQNCKEADCDHWGNSNDYWACGKCTNCTCNSAQPGDPCTTDNECSPRDGVCMGSRCCGSKGKSQGCVSCGPSGECSMCDVGFFLEFGRCKPGLLPGSDCLGDSECSPVDGKCIEGKCCDSSGKSAGCVECNGIGGQCTSCSADFYLDVSGSGICHPDQHFGGICTTNAECTSGSCREKCCNAKGRSKGCIRCDTAGDCAECDDNSYLLTGECSPTLELTFPIDDTCGKNGCCDGGEVLVATPAGGRTCVTFPRPSTDLGVYTCSSAKMTLCHSAGEVCIATPGGHGGVCVPAFGRGICAAHSPCFHGGVCITDLTKPSGYRCECPRHLRNDGHHCTPQFPSPSLDLWTFSCDKDQQASCAPATCIATPTGKKCIEPSRGGICAEYSPCFYGGHCSNDPKSAIGYQCKCPPGTLPPACTPEVAVDPGGALDNFYECTGGDMARCGDDTCITSPVGGGTSVCILPYSRDVCSLYTPCFFGGKCIDNPGIEVGYECLCPPQTEGLGCQPLLLSSSPTTSLSTSLTTSTTPTTTTTPTTSTTPTTTVAQALRSKAEISCGNECAWVVVGVVIFSILGALVLLCSAKARERRRLEHHVSSSYPTSPHKVSPAARTLPPLPQDPGRDIFDGPLPIYAPQSPRAWLSTAVPPKPSPWTLRDDTQLTPLRPEVRQKTALKALDVIESSGLLKPRLGTPWSNA